MTHCPTNNQLAAVLNGDLATEDFDEIVAHIAKCQDCQVSLDNLDGDETDIDKVLKQAVVGSHSQFSREPELQQALNEAKELAGEALSDSAVDNRCSDCCGKIIGDFRLIREIGRGGMGIVYEARQISLDRRVALKILPHANALDQRQLARFEIEAQSAALLSHPNIIPVHSVGCDDGVHFYAMRYVDGCDLEQMVQHVFEDGTSNNLQAVTKTAGRLSQLFGKLPSETKAATNEWIEDDSRSPSIDQGSLSLLSIREVTNEREYIQWVAGIGIQIAEALHAAHEQGIIHRDIKPSNLMLDKIGHIWVMDFGIARIEKNVAMTATGEVLGTLRYSSPEQVLGNRGLVDHRTDIYSLGATLYELLTGIPQFGEPDRNRLISQIADTEPSLPRSHNRAIPVDLETIILKSISKQASKRYSTGEEFSDDLRRFLDNRPISATRPSTWNQLVKWSARNRTMSVAIAISLLASVGLVMGIILHNQRLGRVNNRLASTNDQLEEMNSALSLALDSVEEKQLRMNQLLYAADIQLAEKALADRDPSQAKLLLDRHFPKKGEVDLRGIEWGFLRQQALGAVQTIADHDTAMYALDNTANGKWLSVAGEDSIIYVYNLETHREEYRIPTGQGEINDVVFSPNGDTLATSGDDGTVRLWDWQNQRMVQRIQVIDDEVYEIEFTPDGKQLVSAGSDSIFRVWNLDNGQLAATLKGHTDLAGAIDISPDGKMLVSGSRDGTIRIWDLENAKEVRVVHRMTTPVTSVVFSPNGRYVVAAAKDSHFVYMNRKTGEVRFSGNHHDGILSLDFTHDGRKLMASDRGGNIFIWPIPIDEPRAKSRALVPVREFLAHDGRAYAACFSTDGEHVISTGSDGIIRISSSSQGTEWANFSNGMNHVTSQAISPDGESLFRVGEDGFSVSELTGSNETTFISKAKNKLFGVAVSPSGETIAVGHNNSSCSLYDLNTRSVLKSRTLTSHGRIGPLVFSPDSEILAAACFEVGKVLLLDSRTLENLTTPNTITGFAPCFSPDSKLLAVEDNNEITLWDVMNHKIVMKISNAHRDGIGVLMFTPDGESIVSGGVDRQIRIWDRRLGTLVRTLTGHRDAIEALAFSPDRMTLLSGDRSGSILSWQVASGQKLTSLGKFPPGIMGIRCGKKGHVSVLADNKTHVLRIKRD